VALVAYIVMSVVKAALGSVHGVHYIDKNVSGYYIANEIKGVYQGIMIVVSYEHWFVFRDMPPGDLVGLLKIHAGKVKLRKYKKHPRGAKNPQPKRVFMKNKPHISTARILAERKK
jgi:hypothetical protein